VTEFSKYQYKTNATTRPLYPLTEPDIRSAVRQSDSQGFYRAAGFLSRSTLSQSLLAARPAELRVHTGCRLHVPGPRLVQTGTSVSRAAVPERRQSPAHSRADTVHCPLSLCTCSVIRACLCLEPSRSESHHHLIYGVETLGQVPPPSNLLLCWTAPAVDLVLLFECGRRCLPLLMSQRSRGRLLVTF